MQAITAGPRYEYVPAGTEKLNQIWDRDIAENGGDPQWVAWKAAYLEDNRTGRCKTFLILCDGEPVGQGTLLFSPRCGAVGGRTALANGSTTANVNALRVDKAHEGRGHISGLVRGMEQHARQAGYTTLTIGVEARETRSLGIYLHWGYDTFVTSEEEDGVLVLYYSKRL